MGRLGVQNAGYDVDWSRPLGRGAAGAAYAGVHAPSGTEVVVKESHFPQVLQKEARVMSAVCSHSRYLPDLYLDATRSQTPRRQLVMERGGRPIRQLEGPLPRREAVKIALNLLRAYRAMHAHGFAHLDGHASNILIDGADPESIRLIDFSAAARLENGKGRSVAIAGGKVRSPEQIGLRGTPVEVSCATDLYYAGVLLTTQLQGHNPIVRDDVTAEMIPERLAIARAPDLSGIRDPKLAAILAKALAFRPEDRYQSAQEMIDALRPFAA